MVASIPTMAQKEKERLENERMLVEFLARGGKIEIHETEYDTTGSLKAQHNQSALG
jgi:hypothetical protein